jgi:hypothetical protein
MKNIRLLFSAILLLSGFAKAQSDSVALKPEFGVRDGMYLSYDDFRHNRLIPKEEIVSNIDREQLEFMSKSLMGEKVSFLNNGTQVTIESKRVWGYFQNNVFYINYAEEFYRVPVFGAISYFLADVKVPSVGYYDPRFGYMGGGTTTEIREFLLNYYDGRVMNFSMDAVEERMSVDKELYQEFKALSHKKQREQLHRYLRKFNAQHPVYSLK